MPKGQISAGLPVRGIIACNGVWKMMKWRVIIAVLLILAACSFLPARTISPDDFESITGTSISILRAYEHALKLVDGGGLLFLLDADTLIGPEGRHRINTVFGENSVSIEQRDVNFYWNFVNVEEFKAAFFTVFSGTGLLGATSVWDAEKNEYVSYNWGKHHFVIGLRSVLFGDYKISAGLLSKKVPFIETGSDGKKVFGVHGVTGRGTVEYTFYYDLFFHTDIFGYDLRTAFDFSGGPMFEHLELRKMFDVAGLGSLGPSVGYQRFLNTGTAGLIAGDFMFSGFAGFKGEVFYAFNRDIRGSSLAHSLAEGFMCFFGDPAKRTGKERDFYVSITAGTSYDREVDPSGYWGGMWQAALNNVRIWEGYCRLAFGTATNYYDTLYRYPIKGETVINVDLRYEFDNFDAVFAGGEK